MLALLTGEDAWTVERSLQRLAGELGRDGAAAEVWRVTGAEVDLAALGERLATQPLFGGGTLAVVDDPGPLLRSGSARERLAEAMERIAPGNGLAIVALHEPGGRRPASLDELQRTVTERGGRVLSFMSPTRERMHGFIAERARELGVEIDPTAARLLAERVGAWVRESDVDRRHQAQLAAGELEKLALFRPGGRIGVEDVRALVTEAVPGSVWALLDAVGARRTSEAARLLGRLLADATPLPVLLVQVHRRLRSLIEVGEHLASGAPPEALPRALKMKPFRAQKLADPARAWSLDEVEAALEGLFELDVLVKGLDGVSASDPELELAFELWLVERVARA